MGKFHTRKPTRLQGYDYSRNGAYFLTLCVKGRAEILCGIENGFVILSEYGRIVAHEIIASANLRRECRIDQFVIMPNHVHLILTIINPPVGVDGNRPCIDEKWLLSSTKGRLPSTPTKCDSSTDRQKSPQNSSVSAYIRGMKGAVSRTIGFSIWQQYCNDRIIRDESEYNRIAQYIENNPTNWEKDCFYPIKPK